MRSVDAYQTTYRASAVECERNYDVMDSTHLWAVPLEHDSPERRVAAAMLMQAWVDVSGHPKPRASRFQLVTARAWVSGFWASGRRYPANPGCSFEDICTELGLPVDRTRWAVLNTAPSFEGHRRNIMSLEHRRRVAVPR